MKVNLNADKILNIHEEFEKQIEKYLSQELQRFNEYITGIDIYITDENGIKDGLNGIRCVLEVHIKGMKSIIATEQANSPEQSVHGASRKLKHSIDSLIEKSWNHAMSDTRS